jgi:hypothetical protein
MVMLVPPGLPDIAPRCRLVTREALLDTCTTLSRHRLRHHLETHHGGARRRLMTLQAVNGAEKGPLGARISW